MDNNPQFIDSSENISFPFEINPHEIETDQIIGQGKISVVYKGRCRQKDVCVKVFENQFLGDMKFKAYQLEVKQLSYLRHPNLCLFMGSTLVPDKIMIVTELMSMNLYSFIKNRKPSLIQRMRVAKDAALGINWLHANKLIHRNIKPNNLLVDSNLVVKVSDFGLFQMKKEIFQNTSNNLDIEDYLETLYWQAPEVLLNRPITQKSDVYSFGLILLFLLTGDIPYSEFKDLKTFITYVCYKGYRPSIPDTVPSIRELISDCLESNPSYRPPFSSIVKRLNHIIVDCSINDPLANHFWKSKFLQFHEVSWTHFANEFMIFLGISQPNTKILDLMNNPMYISNQEMEELKLKLKCLKTLLIDDDKDDEALTGNEDRVSINRFGQVMTWFGPIKELNRGRIIDEIYEHLKSTWFHGDITTQEAVDRLLNSEVGTFLLRFSTSSPNSFTISKVEKSGLVLHHRIHKIVNEEGKVEFELDSNQYESLRDIIDKNKERLGLIIPCSGSKYLSIFNIKTKGGYIEMVNNNGREDCKMEIE